MSDTTPDEIKQDDPEPEKPKAEAKKPIDKALAAAAKAAKIEVEEVFAFKDYGDKLVVVARSGQKITVQK